jgi:hypothetical protein
MVDFVRGDAGPGERLGDRDPAELGGGQRGENAGQLADRGASAGDDERT